MIQNSQPVDPAQTTELLILGDGRIFVHNLTPELACLLSQLDPGDTAMRERAGKEIASTIIRHDQLHGQANP